MHPSFADRSPVWNLALRCRRWSGLALLVPLVSCSPDQGSRELTDLRNAESVVIEMDAMAGAQPTFSPLPGGIDPWALFRSNLPVLLPPNVRSIDYPKSSEDVAIIRSTPPAPYSDDELLELAESARDVMETAQLAQFHILFLEGDYEVPAGMIPPRALHIQGTRIIAVFGGARAETSQGPVTEQLALLHELGHAVGLVNLSIPSVTGHEDPQSPGHCTDSSCIMRSTTALDGAVIGFIRGGPAPVLFGPHCLTDLDRAHAQP